MFFANNGADVWRHTLEHLGLVVASTLAAITVGLPLGVALTRQPVLRAPILGLANVFQTIPSLALFGLLIPLPFIGGIGARTAIVALVVYALLPIIRNTYAGIQAVDPAVRDAAIGMGMTDGELLRLVEFPLAAPVILAGIRIATVVGVGIATIAAAIGAGGLGEFIFRGVSMVDHRVILLGAIPAAFLALVLDALLHLVERAVDWRARRHNGMTACRFLAIVSLIVLIACSPRRQAIVIGSKNFTESVILGELLAQKLERAGLPVERKLNLGGTFVCHQAMIAGQLDAYVEYTGTAYSAVLQRPALSDIARVREIVDRTYRARWQLRWGPPLGFENTFAMLVRRADAERLHLRTLSDAARHAGTWRAGFGYEFMERADGFPGLAARYGLKFRTKPSVMDLGLTYRALAEGKVDIIAGNATDGQIPALNLFQLADDRGYFPPYEAAPVVRQSALRRYPALGVVLDSLGGTITPETMRGLNYQVDVLHRDVKNVVAEFLDGTSRPGTRQDERQ
ncbi:MAG: ABC transporter permease subunit [Gemmatimonadetes bacterium]|nr:ABC transporter permease subunit [Gemmatimonadota bacterium]